MGPKNWMDAGEVLGHEELKGCWMPSGAFSRSSFPLSRRIIEEELTCRWL